MTITFKTGNMFFDRAEALVNTVNCVGVMGKGVALEFKHRWPDNYREYKKLCDSGWLRPGKLYIHEMADLLASGPRFLVNFPTKDHWRDNSEIEWIDAGLDELVGQIRALGIRSIAMPPLGCGNGGLDWNEVRPMIEARLSGLEGVEIVVYDPPGYIPPAPAPVFRATFQRALLLKAIDGMDAGNRTTAAIHAAVDRLQRSGVDYAVLFKDEGIGPFSSVLDETLRLMEKLGVVEGYDRPDRAVTLTHKGRELVATLEGEALERAEKLLADIRESGEVSGPNAVLVYHGTSSEHLDDILVSGVSGPSCWGTFEMARHFAGIACEEAGGKAVIFARRLDSFPQTDLDVDEGAIDFPMSELIGETYDMLAVEWEDRGVEGQDWNGCLEVYHSMVCSSDVVVTEDDILAPGKRVPGGWRSDPAPLSPA